MPRWHGRCHRLPGTHFRNLISPTLGKFRFRSILSASSLNMFLLAKRYPPPASPMSYDEPENRLFEIRGGIWNEFLHRGEPPSGPTSSLGCPSLFLQSPYPPPPPPSKWSHRCFGNLSIWTHTPAIQRGKKGRVKSLFDGRECREQPKLGGQQYSSHKSLRTFPEHDALRKRVHIIPARHSNILYRTSLPRQKP